MAKLKDIDVVSADKKSSSAVPTVDMPDDVVTRYVEAVGTIKRAEEVVKRLKPLLVERGLSEVFYHNCEHPDSEKERISSVNLRDSEGNRVQFTWSVKPTACELDEVKDLFAQVRNKEARKVDINDYVGYNLVASFDTSVFYVNGVFNKDHYEVFIGALERAAAALRVANPLTCGKVLQMKEALNQRRWADFDYETNLKIQEVLPTSVSLKALAKETVDTQ